jgi:RHS repeat-associated protein
MSQPFGDNLQCTGTDSSPYKFGKLERDGESGDDHAQHRDYNSNPYRWLTPDPIGEQAVKLDDPQTWNMYMYSHDNPVTDNDPTGLQEQPDCTEVH